MKKSIERYILMNNLHLIDINYSHRFFFLNKNGTYYIKNIKRRKNSCNNLGFEISEKQLEEEILKYRRKIKIKKINDVSQMYM